MNVNSISFGQWDVNTYGDVLDKIQKAAKKNKVNYEKTPLYKAFRNLEENTAGGELTIDKYMRVKDTNGKYPFFPRDSKNPRSLFSNIMKASDYLDENGSTNEAEENGLIEEDAAD